MANKRADGKKNFGGYILAALHDRVTATAKRIKVTNTDVLNEALADWLDKHDRLITPAEAADLLGKAEVRLSDWDTRETPETTGEPR